MRDRSALVWQVEREILERRGGAYFHQGRPAARRPLHRQDPRVAARHERAQQVADAVIGLEVQPQVVGRERRAGVRIGGPLELTPTCSRAADGAEPLGVSIAGGEPQHEFLPASHPHDGLREPEGEVQSDEAASLSSDEIQQGGDRSTTVGAGTWQLLGGHARLYPKPARRVAAAGDPDSLSSVGRSAEIDAVNRGYHAVDSIKAHVSEMAALGLPRTPFVYDATSRCP